MEPTHALEALENALRLAVREVLGSGWTTAKGAPDLGRVRAAQVEEHKRRDGVQVSDDLLSYTEFTALTTLIEKNWDRGFHQVFEDKKRTDAFFRAVEDVRNTIAHSRQLVQFERDLIAGISGQLRNQITLWRQQQGDLARRYYPVIESIIDSFGRVATNGTYTSGPDNPVRVEVGQPVSFDCVASDFRQRGLTWQVWVRRPLDFTPVMQPNLTLRNSGTFSVTLRPTEQHVGENVFVLFTVASPGPYWRHNYHPATGHVNFDDIQQLEFAISPPLD